VAVALLIHYPEDFVFHWVDAAVPVSETLTILTLRLAPVVSSRGLTVPQPNFVE